MRGLPALVTPTRFIESPSSSTHRMDDVNLFIRARTLLDSVLVLILTSIGYAVANAVYNVYFHPLSKFPGPRMAAASRWWKTYVEVYRDESIVDRLFHLHEKYGNVVRIAPDELHFSDPAVYNAIYSPKSRWNKDPLMYAPFGFGSHRSMFSTVEYQPAKKRRDLAAPHFSRKSVLNLQGVIQAGIDELCDAMAQRAAEGKPTDIYSAFRCLNFDNVTSYCFGWSLHMVRSPDFSAEPVQNMQDMHSSYQVWKHFLWLRTPMRLLLSVLGKRPMPYFRVIMKIKEQVDGYLERPEELDNAPHSLIFHSLMDPAQSTKLDKQSVVEEANLLIIAGTDTISNASALGTLFLLSDGGYMRDKLQAELKAIWPRLDDKPSLEVLESSAPYLKAACKESLRLSHGVMSPLLRVVPSQGATLGGHFVSGGTKVGICNAFVHLNPALFPDPHVFRPERWPEPGAESLDTWLVAFSKGPRSCIGINLGWCELYMNLANLFRRFDLKLDHRVQVLFLGGSRVRAYDLWYQDRFLPYYQGPDLLVHATPVSD